MQSVISRPSIRPGVCSTSFGRCQSALHRPCLAARAKGFSSDGSADERAPDAAPSTSAAPADDSLEALEARIRNKARRKGKVEAKVAVESAAVSAATGKAAPTPELERETAYVVGLGFLFVVIILEGLALAGAGFLPEAADAWIQDNLYPTYSYVVLAFLGASSLYGLFKTGKLPGQQQL